MAIFQRINLQRSEEVTFRLLDNPETWRTRSVERIDFASSLWVQRNRILHVKPLRATLGEELLPSIYESAWIRLPVGAFPRILLFGFEAEVAGREVYRVSVQENGLLLAKHLEERGRRLASHIMAANGSAGDLQMCLLEPRLRAVLSAICMFEAGAWHNMRTRYRGDALWAYLRNGILPPGTAGHQQAYGLRKTLSNWKSILAPVFPAFRNEQALRETDSPAANPLLVLPLLKANGVFQGLDEVPGLLFHLIEFIRIAQSWAASNPYSDGPIGKSARALLEEYEFLGHHWVALVDCLVPADEPFVASVTERRAMDLTQRSRSVFDLRQALTMKRKDLGPTAVFRDARANHLSLRITDPNVEFGGECKVRAAYGGTSEVKPDLIREKGDLLLVYSSEENRPALAHIECTLQPTLPLRMIHWVVLGVAALTFAAILAGGQLSVGYYTAPHVALLLTPSTFASALLLSRESSSLSGALARPLRLLLAVALAALWILAVVLYLTNSLHLTEQKPTPSPSATHSAASS